jgi:hypothetical protein
MLGLISLALAAGSTVFGYVAARRFVRDRLRFVDAAQGKAAPLIAGVGAALLAAPVTWIAGWLLPIGVGTAVLFGLGVGAGVANGANDIRRGTPYQITSGS